jgi:hypothetical protein
MTKMAKHDLIKDMLSRHKARERVSKTLANLKLNANLNAPQTLQTEATMTYTVNIPYRNTDYIFGTAYPHLSLRPGQKGGFIRAMLAASLDENQHMLSVENDNNKNRFEVEIRISGRKGYDAAIDISSAFPHRRRGLNVLAWRTKLFNGNSPQHNFLLETKMYAEVLTWVTENVKPTDYQIYSKFGGDISIGFRDMSHATMFKLVFAEEDI